jgi:hypothetical protein
MDDLGKVNIGIVNAVIKLTKKGQIKWSSKTFTKSTKIVYVPEDSVVIVQSTTVKDKVMELFITAGIPKYLKLDDVLLLNSTAYLNEVTTPPLEALYRSIKGTPGNLEILMREDFLLVLNKMIDSANY